MSKTLADSEILNHLHSQLCILFFKVEALRFVIHFNLSKAEAFLFLLFAVL